MSPELEAAAAEATTDEAWVKFTAACAAWCRDVLHSPEDHRALADAACEYAGKRVERHVAEEREAILGRGPKASEAPAMPPAMTTIERLEAAIKRKNRRRPRRPREVGRRHEGRK